MTTVKYEMDGAVGIVTMAKPPHNLLDDAMLDDLLSAYQNVQEQGCRAILLRSSMRHFCAGAELASFSETTIQADRVRYAAMLDVLENTEVPTLAAVHGGVLGGGLEVALTCDLIMAADTAFLGQVEVTVGLLPVLGGTQRLSQRAGAARAKQIAMLGRRHSAEAFERWGIVNVVVPEADLADSSLSMARQLAAGPTKVLKGIKMQANLEARGGIGAADQKQVDINDMIWKSADRERGMKAFFVGGAGSALYQGD